MIKVLNLLFACIVLLAGFAAVYETGKRAGFRTGSEWALMQADIVAREAGIFMPVYMKDGKFRVVMRQPRGVYKRAWQLADRFEEQGALKTAKLQENEAEIHAARKQAEL